MLVKDKIVINKDFDGDGYEDHYEFEFEDSLIDKNTFIRKIKNNGKRIDTPDRSTLQKVGTSTRYRYYFKVTKPSVKLPTSKTVNIYYDPQTKEYYSETEIINNKIEFPCKWYKV